MVIGYWTLTNQFWFTLHQNRMESIHQNAFQNVAFKMAVFLLMSQSDKISRLCTDIFFIEVYSETQFVENNEKCEREQFFQ